MTDEERWNMNKWDYEYYGRRDTSSASSAPSRSFWYGPHGPDELEKERMANIKDEVWKQELRLRDIRDTYKMMELSPSDILRKLEARGTCTVGEPAPQEVEEVEEDEDKEFLFDPKELDI